jgi:hypothetical protein
MCHSVTNDVGITTKIRISGLQVRNNISSQLERLHLGLAVSLIYMVISGMHQYGVFYLEL